MKRRDFLKATLGGTAATLCTTAEARPNLEPAPEAVGMLFDSTLCVGCKACVSICKELNDMPPVTDNEQQIWDSARDLSGETLNVIKVYKDGDAKTKDAEINGYCFEKRSCMHCVDPGCVSVCPCTAMRQHKVTGIVTHHADVCIGCRNCMVGCPYNVPQFEYNELFGQIQKCQMCNQAGLERVDKGQMTGCAEVCPTGATLFGPRKALLQEAKHRMQLKPGEIYNYPRGDVSKPYSHHEKEVPAYRDHIWGEKEAGGTSVMHISSVPFDKLGMPAVGDRSAASVAETVQHSIYSFMALPAVALAGLTYVVRRNTDDDNDGGES
ncbi:MAG: hydrogenase 2 operon protein HybA [Gammaproteobacteria bacterium]|jgi:Fe-S-cluster-containing dehydrogenase component|nr:hydrogenase 2 operon protein HybA [Gammaproteobacteria bacterium]MBT3725932.1 hydrogenase 2 operon protein HybA [Gammaproteobacteria bacterium]MBT4078892.1 hydrogenase 2 operon protein HybA [Gammaproteobacteria bacterium]MBT4195871.1 hydrogenase 2 operon protein HybA [Gammaproteobacteria bacterium]MBT4448979.1 hydrogenase 2 operon protein HybA [Gammaproteobacteria bacterium]